MNVTDVLTCMQSASGGTLGNKPPKGNPLGGSGVLIRPASLNPSEMMLSHNLQRKSARFIDQDPIWTGHIFFGSNVVVYHAVK